MVQAFSKYNKALPAVAIASNNSTTKTCFLVAAHFPFAISISLQPARHR
jgi:hypothetical protein